MPEPSIQAEIDEGTGTAFITLSRPPLNILDIEAFTRLGDVLEESVGNAGCSLVVIRAAGEKAFCAGADVGDHVPEKVAGMLGAFHRAVRYLRAMDAVSIAAVKGAALGGGCELALACDLILASENAVFGQPEILLGCFPPVALAALPPVAGRHRTADLVLTGRKFTAFEALAMGIASRVVPAEEFEGALAALLAELQGRSRSVLKATARALRLAEPSDFEAALARMEKAYLEDLMRLEDAKEGIRAFMEKRKPRWSGR